MLDELVIENYAVVDRLQVRFHAGLNLLTGETGSGKSIVVDALGLLLGGRASIDMIRSGAERARVSGVFEAGPDAIRVLGDAGFESSGSELLLDREILTTGKGRVWVNNRPATVALLKELAPHLGDIHGQHDQQLLFEPASQLAMLDAFAHTEKQRARLRGIFIAWKNAADAIRAIETEEQEKLRMLDLWQFQRREIESAELQPGEDTQLEAERRVQQNAGRLLENASAAYELLYEAPESALAAVRAAAKKIDDLARIDTSMESLRQALEPASIAIQDAAYSLRDYLGRVEANPTRLEEVEARLVAIDRLKRKYGGSVEEIIAFGADVARRIAEVETSGERLDALRHEQRQLAAEYEKAAADLSECRRHAGRELAQRVERELKPLAMERTRFEVKVEPAAWSENGADRIAFLVSPNVGEEPRPLERVASGGELSRIALALKTCLVGGHRATGTPRTLVFDEIDSGIGGRAAEGVARRLRTLAAENQVLCVTHLPQIACFADHHYRVGKIERTGRTVAGIEELTRAESTEEIGRMLSGQHLTPEALRNAAELMRAAQSG
jgi:DNA repair protein RecN (Recombination protein N)